MILNVDVKSRHISIIALSYVIWYWIQNFICILRVGPDLNFRENAISLADKLRSPEDHVWCWWFNRKNGTLLSDKKIEMRTFVLIACFLFSHPPATHPWSIVDACRWLFQDKQREKDLLSNHRIVERDIQVSFFYFWSCLFLMILFVMMVI